MKKGKFIVFEGLDASGKTTQAHNLSRRLDALGISCACTKEPTDSLPGSIARSAINKKTSLQNETLTLLFLADRVEHVVNDILPALGQGRTVISDRYYLSNMAYQGLQMDMKLLLQLNEMMVLGRLIPDLTVFLDVSPEECSERINRDRLHKDLYEEIDKQTAIRNNFFHIFEMMKDRENVLIIKSGDDIDNTFEKIWLKVSRLFTNEDGEVI